MNLKLDLDMTKIRSIEWSFSRREVLEQCPRRYYYQYYGANTRTAKAEPQKETLGFLKTLSNRHMRTGSILHLVIRTYLMKLQKGEVWTLERMLKWAQEIYRQDREHSRSNNYDSSVDNVYKPIPLLEFYYRFQDAEELYAGSEQRLLEAIRNFMTSELFAPFHVGSTQANALIERRFRLNIGSLTVRGQIDLAYPDDGETVICDWKIGGNNGPDSNLQLLSYALWAVDQYGFRPSEITIYKAHLAEERLSRFVVSTENLCQARARIIQDLEKMQALDAYGRNGIAEAFTPCGSPLVCALCPFQEVCPKEG